MCALRVVLSAGGCFEGCCIRCCFDGCFEVVSELVLRFFED